MSHSTEKNVSLSDALDTYIKNVMDWVNALQKASSAVKKLKAAVEKGEVRSIETLRQVAMRNSDSARDIAMSCPEFTFDTPGYLNSKTGYFREIESLAKSENLSCVVRDGVIFSFPLIITPEPGLSAIRIDKKLRYQLKPSKLVEFLKKEQAKEASNRPAQFIEALFKTYDFERMKSKKGAFVSIELSKLYNILTILPGISKEYSKADFARDIYFLDISDVRTTRNGNLLELTYSTASREQEVRAIEFVARDGSVKRYYSVLFMKP